MRNIRVLLDMDNVLANFSFDRKISGQSYGYHHHQMYQPNFFLELEPVAYAKEYVRMLYNMENVDLYICTKPLMDSPECYFEKAAWVNMHFPFLRDKLILTQDKTLIDADYIIDDHEDWCKYFNEFREGSTLFPVTECKKELQDAWIHSVARVAGMSIELERKRLAEQNSKAAESQPVEVDDILEDGCDAGPGYVNQD